MCLRTYSNQRLHDSLSRGSAIAYLEGLWRSEEERAASAEPKSGWEQVLDLCDPAIAGLVIALEGEVPTPAVGLDVGPQNDWQVELAWVDQALAVIVDEDLERNHWLEQNGWTVVSASPGFHLESALEVIRLNLVR